MVLMFETVVDSFAVCLERSKLGMAIVAMIRMIATTISNSKSEKPRLFFIGFLSKSGSSVFELNPKSLSWFSRVQDRSKTVHSKIPAQHLREIATVQPT